MPGKNGSRNRYGAHGNGGNNHNRGRGNNNQPVQQDRRAADAAYNFVSLPTKILKSQLDDEYQMAKEGEQTAISAAYKDYLKAEKCYDGYIDLDIELLTPGFIGGKGADSFFAVDKNHPIIPGSTLRGMVRNIFKIITLGTMRPDEDFYERHLYYRCIMTTGKSQPWEIALHALYQNQMTDGDIKKTRPGFLIKTRVGYFICPMTSAPNRVLIREYERKYGDTVKRGMKDVRVEWKSDSTDSSRLYAYAISGAKKKRDNDKDPDNPDLFETIAEYEAFKERHKEDGKNKRIGKQFVWEYPVQSADWSECHWIPVDDLVAQEYRDDKNRRGVNLMTLRSKDKKGGAYEGNKLREVIPDAPKCIEQIAPCFYLADENNMHVTSFGHGQYFRIPYKYSIGDAVPAMLKNSSVIDFADAVFGKAAMWSSRVFFEDAVPVGEVKYDDVGTAHPLLSANPTSFQLYLRQNPGTDAVNWGNEKAQIRGYKFYWHKKNADWHATKSEEEQDEGKRQEERMTREITPISKGNHFCARIRFENLHAAELGALMMVFDLNGAEHIAYKLGMGKSIGLGSVRIKPKLFVDNPEDYSVLFTEGGWNQSAKEEAGTKYLDAFKKYVDEKGVKDSWARTLDTLAVMLNWDDNVKLPNWEKHASSMSGDVKKGTVDERYKTRAFLPSPKGVLKLQ